MTNRIHRYYGTEPTVPQSQLGVAYANGRRDEREEWERRWLADVDRAYWAGVEDGRRQTWWWRLVAWVRRFTTESTEYPSGE